MEKRSCECGCGTPITALTVRGGPRRFVYGHYRLQAPESRFWERIRWAANGCWVWTGSRFATGYGQLDVCGSPILVHRFAYGLLVGPIPDGYDVHHECRQRLCANPAHLEAIEHGAHAVHHCPPRDVLGRWA